MKRVGQYLLPDGYITAGVYYYNKADFSYDRTDTTFYLKPYFKVGRDNKVAIVAIKKINGETLSPEIFTNFLIKNEFNSKSILNLGDSIAAGAGNNEKSYADYIALKNYMKLNDQAQNGATIADAYVSVYRKVNSLIASDNKQYDYILLEGGCNDIHQSVPLGDITDEDYDVTNCDITTVCGALETIIFNLRTK